MAGGGVYRQDTFRFGIGEEAVDGTIPAVLNTNLGIIKSGITLPDPDFDWDFFFGVNREGRGRRNAHPGNQNFTGSVAQIYMLFNESRDILELALGELSRDAVALAGTNPGVITGVTATTMTDSGENFTTVDSGGTVKGGDHAVFSGISIGYIGTDVGGGVTEVTVYPTPNRSGTQGWNGPQPAVGDEYEIRRTESVGSAAGDKFLVGSHRLNTMTWGAQFRNTKDHGATSVGSFLTVNYVGGKVNRATISARAGEKVILALDEVLFRDLRHDSALPSSSVAKFSGSVITPAPTFPTEEPMVFSEGTVALFELTNTFARIRDFSLTVNHNLTAERYVSTVTSAGVTVVSQVPFEFIEGNRAITMEITAVMETREYWEHLMREGLNDALSAKTGFDIFLRFQNAAGTENFYIQGPAHANPVIINDNTLPINITSAQSAAGNVGGLFTAAPNEVPGEGEPLITVRMSIDLPSIVLWWDDS